MADFLPSLTSEHRDLLRHFVWLVDEMSRSRFIESCRRQKQTISFRDGVTTAPDYDWEDFRSFLTIFRQVAISRRERVHITKIVSLLEGYASDDFRKRLDEVRTKIFPLLEGRYKGIRFGRDSQNGDEISLTTAEILDALVNGQIFHADAKHQLALGFLNASERWQYLFPLLGEFIMPTLRALIWMFHAIRRDGLLPDEDYPAHCKGKQPA